MAKKKLRRHGVVNRVKEGYSFHLLTRKVASVLSSIRTIIAVAVAMFGALLGYLTNRGAVDSFAREISAWAYGDNVWSGLFNGSGEGYVDASSMKLSDTSMQLVLIAKNGEINGVASEKGLCKVGAPYDFKLVRGSALPFSTSVSVDVFDFEYGYLVIYAKMVIALDGPVVEVSPRESKKWTNDENIRLVKAPDVNVDDAMASLSGFCSDEPGNMYNRKGVRREGGN